MSAVEKSCSAWGGNPPDWVIALAEACEATSGRAVAKRLGVSPAAVCRLLGATYGDTTAMESRVRAELMATHVTCPVCGRIDVATCRTHQTRPFTAVNPLFVRLFRACPTCPHREGEHERHPGHGSDRPATEGVGTLSGDDAAASRTAQGPRAAARTARGGR